MASLKVTLVEERERGGDSVPCSKKSFSPFSIFCLSIYLFVCFPSILPVPFFSAVPRSRRVIHTERHLLSLQRRGTSSERELRHLCPYIFFVVETQGEREGEGEERSACSLFLSYSLYYSFQVRHVSFPPSEATGLCLDTARLVIVLRCRCC